MKGTARFPGLQALPLKAQWLLLKLGSITRLSVQRAHTVGL